MSDTEVKIDIVELGGKIDRMADNIEVVKQRCEEMAVSLSSVKKAVYDPDQGLYARLRELEQWKESQAKVQWTIITTVIGLVAATAYKMMIST